MNDLQFDICLAVYKVQSGGKKGVQLLNTLSTV